jgi:hypothetical protein
MAQVRILFFAVAALALAGCAKSTCDKAADGYYAYRSAALGCAYVIPSIKIGDACAANDEKCTSDDAKLIDDYGDCLTKIAKCEVGKEQEFADAETACYGKLSALSAECAASLSLLCTTSTNQAWSLVDAYDNADGMASSCTEPPATPHTYKTADACMLSITSCSNADLTALATYANCLISLPECADDTKADFEAAVAACNTALSLSAACSEALTVKAE